MTSVGTESSALSVRCSEWTWEQGVDPIGSALVCDTFVLVETPPPWPRDVGDIPTFADVMRGLPPGVRLLAVAPADEPVTAADSRTAATVETDAGTDRDGGRPGVRVTLWRRRNSNGFQGSDHVVPRDRLTERILGLLDRAPSLDLGRGLGVDPNRGRGLDRGRDPGVRPGPGHGSEPGAGPGLDPDPGPGEWASARPAPVEVLLCGHGQRDRCCGRIGTRLHLDVASAWPGVRVRRCSHTGGHRFAPTGFTFPDGRAWGFLDAPTLDGIVRRANTPAELRGRYRGSTALDQWGQVAERELFERFGWGWLDHELTASRTEVVADGRLATVELAWQGPTGAATATASVAVVRNVPVPLCGEALDHAEKTSPELSLRSIEMRRTRGTQGISSASARSFPPAGNSAP
ncbi:MULTISPECIES: sucrase ferredoxin [Protofrankia]|uniref:sucrase ferredoxin n=1 Tax=Protofrankia TaxID=2994361 RepID=UPI000A3E8247|nr:MULTISPECIES: sucrase ferredoxin [Protofrankia]